MNAIYFDAKSMKSNALAPTKPIQSVSGAILAQDNPEHRFVMISCRFGVPFWKQKMVQKSIPKARHFQASLETLFFTIGDPKNAKTRFQKYVEMEPFLESDETTEPCSRLHAYLVFEV